MQHICKLIPADLSQWDCSPYNWTKPWHFSTGDLFLHLTL